MQRWNHAAIGVTLNVAKLVIFVSIKSTLENEISLEMD